MKMYDMPRRFTKQANLTQKENAINAGLQGSCELTKPFHSMIVRDILEGKKTLKIL